MENEADRGSLSVVPGQVLSVSQAESRRLQASILATWNRIAVKSGCPDLCIPVDKTNPSHYPHTCPRYSGPAYIGAVEVDCAGGCK